MIDVLREVQIPFLAVLLLIASLTKAFSREDHRGPAASPHRGRSFAVTVTVVEATLGTLLLTTSLGVVRLAGVVFFATATSVVADLARRGSEEGCGCFGGLSRTPSGRLGVIRAALLTLAAIASAGVPLTGVQVLREAGAGPIAVLAVESAAFLLLSPELAAAVDRARHPVPCELRDVPISATYSALRASGAWRAHAALLTSDEPVEVWRELCHRYVVYPAEIDGRATEVVFAVPIDGRRSVVRVGLVTDPAYQDDDSGPQRVHTPA